MGFLGQLAEFDCLGLSFVCHIIVTEGLTDTKGDFNGDVLMTVLSEQQEASEYLECRYFGG